jgi:hypothetical protein
MLRAVLLGILSVSAVAACKKESANAASSQPGVAAGKVIEVKGSVTVKHGGATRPLVAGESVEGSDTVMTGADGNVVIELAHNLVRWELGPGKVQQVNESIAWKAAKSTGPAEHVDQDTAAAGRPAERSAVGTTASEVEAKEEGEGAAPAPGAAPPPPPAAELAAAPTDEKKMDDAPAKTVRQRTRRTSRAKAEAAPMKEVASAESAPMEETVGTKRGATRGGPTIIAKTVGGGDNDAMNSAPPGGQMTTRSIQAPKAPPMATAQSTESMKAAPPGPPGPTVSSLVAGKQAQLKACLGGHSDDVRLILTVTGGKASVQFSSKTKVTAQLEACMKKVINSISFKADGAASTTIKP